jgi:DNA helicase-2/ATP-dependent DNA helicase PcrA
MLGMPLRLFTARPDVLRVLQDSYRCVVCDEFQDICAVQYELLRQLAARHRHLAVVGDPCQAVFGWRGADARFLLDVARDFPDARRIDLIQNYRSTGQIVAVANALGARLASRPPLWTKSPAGPPVFLQALDDEQAEAAFVVSEIRRLLDTGVVGDLAHVAVLFRTNHQVAPLTVAFRARGVRYRARNGMCPHRSDGLAISDQGPPAVLLTTIHSAKGGEWRVVFVVGIEEGLLPHHRALAADRRSGCGLDEELRVLYVAVTRAQERLYLSYCRTRQVGARRENRHPSRFLSDLRSNVATQRAA